MALPVIMVKTLLSVWGEIVLSLFSDLKCLSDKIDYYVKALFFFFGGGGAWKWGCMSGTSQCFLRPLFGNLLHTCNSQTGKIMSLITAQARVKSCLRGKRVLFNLKRITVFSVSQFLGFLFSAFVFPRKGWFPKSFIDTLLIYSHRLKGDGLFKKEINGLEFIIVCMSVHVWSEARFVELALSYPFPGVPGWNSGPRLELQMLLPTQPRDEDLQNS